MPLQQQKFDIENIIKAVYGFQDHNLDRARSVVRCQMRYSVRRPQIDLLWLLKRYVKDRKAFWKIVQKSIF